MQHIFFLISFVDFLFNKHKLRDRQKEKYGKNTKKFIESFLYENSKIIYS